MVMKACPLHSRMASASRDLQSHLQSPFTVYGDTFTGSGDWDMDILRGPLFSLLHLPSCLVTHEITYVRCLAGSSHSQHLACSCCHCDDIFLAKE